MKFICIALFFLCRMAFASAEVRTVSQPLDHANKSRGVIQQRIQIGNWKKLNKKTAPVIFFVAGEGEPMDVSRYASIYGSTDQGQKGFIAIVADHRGYGAFSTDADQSVPKYVTVDQAIEDFHADIQMLRKEFTGPWVIAGFSYAGGLAVELASRYPQDADVVISSSGVLSWPFTFTGHADAAAKEFPAEMIDNLAKVIKGHPYKVFGDQAWQEVDDLHWNMWELTQYEFAAGDVHYWNDHLKAAKTPDEFFSKSLPVLGRPEADSFQNGRGQVSVSLSDVSDGSYWGRYWAYQQCYEMGGFSTSRDGKVYPADENEYRDYCQTMFGVRPTFSKIQDWKKDAASLKVPLVSVVGELDPWLQLELLSTDPQPARGQYIFAKGHYHIPDTSDGETAQQVMDAAWSYFPKR